MSTIRNLDLPQLRVVVIVISTSILSACAPLKPELIAALPRAVSESSGLAITDSAQVWTLNDSQHPPTLYRLDYTGRLADSVIVAGAANRDWEDLASDASHLYVADIGNNMQTRKDFTIYILTHEADADQELRRVVFNLSDAPSLLPKMQNRNFDSEAIFVRNNFIYIISKNLKPCGKTFSKLYRVPATPGQYTATPIDSFAFDEPITGAAYDDVENRLVVTGYLSCFVFDYFDEVNWHNAAVKQYHYNTLRQYEGIAFDYNKQRMFLSSERGMGKKAALFVLPVSALKSGSRQRCGPGYALRLFKLTLILLAYNSRLTRLAAR